MSKIDVYAEGSEGGDRYINPYDYDAAEDFVADYSDEDYFYVGPKNRGIEVSEKLPEVVWYLAKYSETYGFHITRSLFQEYGFFDGKNLVSMPGLEPDLARCREYASPDELADAYMDHHKVPDAIREAVNVKKLVDNLTAHRVIGTNPMVVEWNELDAAITEGWG